MASQIHICGMAQSGVKPPARKKENEMFNKMNVKMHHPTDAGGTGGGNNQTGGAGTGQGQGTAGQQGWETPPLQFEAWVKEQKPEVTAMLEGHIKGLKSALDSERGSRKDLEKQLRDLAKKAEEGSDAQKKLTEMADQISTADRRVDFYEEAHKAGVANLKLAFLVATQDELFDKQGRVSFDGMKKDYPELFGATTKTRGDAGSGTEKKQKASGGMNEFIRRAAGRSE